MKKNYKMYGKIIKIVKTTADGYITVITTEMRYRFKNLNCCPEKIKIWLAIHPDKFEQVEYNYQITV